MPLEFTTRPEIRGTFGAVATTHWIASTVAMSVLERGGNAFDAAAAAGFVLQIVEPHLVGPGGEVPIVLKRADAPEPIVICGQGPYPEAATPERFAGLGLEQVPGTGLLPSVVPGAFDAWMVVLREHGTWRLADILEPAIGYAENGFPVLPRVASSILAAKDFFANEWPSSAAVWLPHGEVRGREHCIARLILPQRIAASLPRRSPRARTATRRSKRPGTPIIGASLPRRSIASTGRLK